jgi:nucleoid-associated protein YgaU
MTTDAKIGLLLGLVFIVIIAFVINGLPSFNKSENSNDLTNNYVTRVGDKPMGLPSGQPLDGGDTNVITPQIADINGKNGDSSLIAKQQEPITQVNNVAAVIETPLPTEETVMTVGTQKQAEPALTPVETTQVQAETPTTAAAASEQKSTVHVVKKGENLGKIAQDYYGTQGPKRENVVKIAKANHLKSEKQIRVGQKLVIPGPAALVSKNPSMFEQVQNVTKSLTGSSLAHETPAVEKGVKDYVVKSGDYPWKIAKKELGNGNRYKEILKCNPNINENTTLSIGMHLKLPPR